MLERTRYGTAVLLAALFTITGYRSAPPGDGDGRTAGALIREHAMVVSAHPLATEVGLQVLRDGGNAVDAAVAVHHALAVVAPWAGNIGGGGFMVVRMADGTVHTLDFRETAPSSSTRDMYLDEHGVVDPKLCLVGHKAIGVPGSVAGMFAVRDSLGRLPMERLLDPAIELANKGFRLTANEAEELNKALPLLRANSTRPNAFTAKETWAAGDVMRNTELANTLTRIRDNGAAELYTGSTAELLIAEMQRGKGTISRSDLAAYRPRWREAVHGRYRGHDIYSMGPPSSGGTALIQLLNAMEPMDVHGSGWHKAPTVHRMVEAERRVYADRATYMGDPDAVPIPLSGLLSPGYMAQRMADLDLSSATPSVAVAAGAPPHESDQTTHFSIVDAEGNAVSCTTTLNAFYGSHVVVGGAGFVLNNEMDDFSAAPGTPNAYGLVGGEANAIAPGKRMLSSMTPTIVVRDGKVVLVLGTPGGSSIITTVFQVIMNVLDHGMTMQQAVNAPRFHFQWLPDMIQTEAGAITGADSLELVQMGHTFVNRSPYGRVDAIHVLDDGRLEGGADPRGDDHAAGY
ncbi:MAG TPA: gamma-glutamyltransferase [Flavobacteriales bacterium]